GFSELASHGDDLAAVDAGDALLPRWRVGYAVVVVVPSGDATHAAIDAVVREQQVEYGGDEHLLASACVHSTRGHSAQLNLGQLRRVKELVVSTAKVRKCHPHDRGVREPQLRQAEVHLVAGSGVDRVE